jgi:hypothetical protein
MGHRRYSSTYSNLFHSAAASPPGESALGAQWIGGWMGLRAGLEVVASLSGIEVRSCRP